MNTSSSNHIGAETLRSQPWVALCFALCRNRAGRALLHFTAMLRKPQNLRWHWQGIRREFSGRARDRVAFRHYGACEPMGTDVTCTAPPADSAAISRTVRVTSRCHKKIPKSLIGCAAKVQTISHRN
jgi:hypothetical protein